MFVTLEVVLKEKEKKYFPLFCLLFGLRQTLSPWVIWDCHLQIGTCRGHLPSTYLPLWGLNHVLLQLLTFNTPWKEFRVESRNEALCAQGKAGRTGLQMVRYFQEPILRAQFWYLLICRKAVKSFMAMTVHLILMNCTTSGSIEHFKISIKFWSDKISPATFHLY